MVNNLRSLRTKKGISMKALGEQLGVSESTVSLYETGKRSPDITMLVRLADFYGTSVDYLIGHEKEPAAKGDELTPQEHDLLCAYRAASPDDRAIIDNIVRRYTHAPTTERFA